MLILPPNSEQPTVNDGKRDFLKKAASMSAAAAIMSLVPPGVRSAARNMLVRPRR